MNSIFLGLTQPRLQNSTQSVGEHGSPDHRREESSEGHVDTGSSQTYFDKKRPTVSCAERTVAGFALPDSHSLKTQNSTWSIPVSVFIFSTRPHGEEKMGQSNFPCDRNTMTAQYKTRGFVNPLCAKNDEVGANNRAKNGAMSPSTQAFSNKTQGTTCVQNCMPASFPNTDPQIAYMRTQASKQHNTKGLTLQYTTCDLLAGGPHAPVQIEPSRKAAAVEGQFLLIFPFLSLNRTEIR